MSYAYIDYKDENDIQDSYSQKELEIREEFLKIIETNSSELLYEPKDFRQTDPRVLDALIGTVSTFKEAFVILVKRLADIFFTLDPYDMIPMAIDLMDHYMSYYKPDKIPFDPTSGRSSTLYMDMIREEEDIKPLLARESSETEEGEAMAQVSSPTSPTLFYNKIHPIVSQHGLTPDRIFQLDLHVERYKNPNYESKAPWDADYDPDGGYESTTLRLCVNAEGKSILLLVDNDYDLNSDTFFSFLTELRKLTKASQKKPILLLTCRRVRAFNLDVIYYCRQHGILVSAFPAYFSKYQPLSKRVIPLFQHGFSETFSQLCSRNQTNTQETGDMKRKERDSVSTPRGAAALMSTIMDQILTENVEQLRMDFRRCLKLDACISFKDRPNQGELPMETEECSDVTSDALPVPSQSESQPDYNSLKSLKLKTKPPREDENELNELMFAQIGPLRESDYY